MTLLETMIAMLIFLVGITGTTSMLISSMRMNARSNIQTYDIVAASHNIENILSLPFDHPLLKDPDDGFSPDTPDHGPFPISVTHSTVEWEVDSRFPVPYAKRVSITVRTRKSINSRKEIRYDFIKSREIR